MTRIDHTTCEHASTPYARKQCRAAVRALGGHTFDCVSHAGERAFMNEMINEPTGPEARQLGLELIRADIVDCICEGN